MQKTFEKINLIEKAVHDGNYNEEDLFNAALLSQSKIRKQ